MKLRKKKRTTRVLSIGLTVVTITSTLLVPMAIFADGDGFILRRGTSKGFIDRPVEEESDNSDLFKDILKGITKKKETGTWNNKGKVVSEPKLEGKVVLPVAYGKVTSQFGVRWNTDYHKGIDIAGNAGASVVLPVDCKIVDSKINQTKNDSAGNYVKATSVADPNIVFIFMHLAANPRINGQLAPKMIGKTFPAGTEVGKVGSTGNSTGPHLHFQMQKTKDAMTGGEAAKFRGTVPPLHALFGDNLEAALGRNIQKGPSNNKNQNKLIKWRGKTLESLEIK